MKLKGIIKDNRIVLRLNEEENNDDWDIDVRR